MLLRQRNLVVLVGFLLLLPPQLHSQELAPRTPEVQPRPQSPPPPPPPPPAPRTVQPPPGRSLTINEARGRQPWDDGHVGDGRQYSKFGRGISRRDSAGSWEEWDRLIGRYLARRWSPGSNGWVVGSAYVYPAPNSLALVSIEDGLWVSESETANGPLEVHFAVRGAPGTRYGVEAVVFRAGITGADAEPGSDLAVQRAVFDSQLEDEPNPHSLLLHRESLEPGEYILAVALHDHARGAITLPVTVNFAVSPRPASTEGME